MTIHLCAPEPSNTFRYSTDVVGLFITINSYKIPWLENGAYEVLISYPIMINLCIFNNYGQLYAYIVSVKLSIGSLLGTKFVLVCPRNCHKLDWNMCPQR